MVKFVPYPDRPAAWLRVGELRQRMEGLPDDSPVQIEYPPGSANADDPALYAYAQASDAAGVCGTDPMAEATCGVLIIGCDPDDPMAADKGA